MTAAIRKGNPFAARNSLETVIAHGLSTSQSARRSRVRFHASSGGHCARRNVLHITQSQSVAFDAAAQLYTKIGSTIHSAFQDALFKEDALLFSEYHLPEIETLKLGGYVDAIAVLEQNKVYGLEFKSCGKVPIAVSEEHYKQALIYGAVTGLPMIVLYMARSVAGWDRQLHLKSFKLAPTDAEYCDVLTILALSTLAAAANQTPPIPARFASQKDCGYCPFKSTCWPLAGALAPATPPDAPAWPTMDAATYAEMFAKAHVIATDLVATRDRRRNGVLKHLAKNGTPTARRLLQITEWDTLF